jgi:hypothetical protein
VRIDPESSGQMNGVGGPQSPGQEGRSYEISALDIDEGQGGQHVGYCVGSDGRGAPVCGAVQFDE